MRIVQQYEEQGVKVPPDSQLTLPYSGEQLLAIVLSFLDLFLWILKLYMYKYIFLQKWYSRAHCFVISSALRVCLQNISS
jgi:hypothetical protein